MPLTHADELLYTRRINSCLDDVPVRCAADFDAVIAALKAIAACDGSDLCLGKLQYDTALQHVAGMLEVPTGIKVADHGDYRSLIISRIKSRIKEFKHMSASQKEAYIAAQKQRQDTVDAMLQQMHCSTEDPPLLCAASMGQLDEVKTLLDKEHVDVNCRDDYGITPLLTASLTGKPDVVQCLLDHGADTEAAGPDGMTPLLGASLKGHIEIVEILLKANVDRNARNSAGQSAYDLAMSRGHTDVAAKLPVQMGGGTRRQ